MKRHLFDFISALSMVLLLTVLFFWVRSDWRRDSLRLDHVDFVRPNFVAWHTYAVYSDSGRVWAFRMCYSARGQGQDEIGWSLGYENERPHPPEGLFRYRAYWDDAKGVGRLWCPFVGVPDALLVVLLSVLPLMKWRAWRRQQKRNPKACGKCGYDLRAMPVRCPECGMAVDSLRLKSL